MIKSLLIILVSILFMGSCCHKKAIEQNEGDGNGNPKEEATAIAKEKYAQFTVVPNDGASHIVAIDHSSFVPREMNKNFRFFLYKTSTSSIIIEDHIILGTLYWEDAENLIVKNYPLQIDDEQPMDLGYRFNVIDNSKTPL